MKFNVITLFPKMFEGPLSESILKRAQKNSLIDINLINLRDFAIDKHKTVDDTPYGGGAGMVLRVDIVDHAISNLKSPFGLAQGGQISNRKKVRTILLTPTGTKFDQKKAIELAKYDELTLIAGHYEGFDQRIHEHLVDEEISIGDYVLTGGELPAMVMIDTISRMIPGVIKEESAANESFMNGDESDYPVYTRPVEYNGWKVPEVLQNGNHAEIEKWRNEHKK
ncbi:MAG: tRNA (guanosine(37)-N1)-methyltransferase TrmD [Patescibacteria group bacterium]